MPAATVPAAPAIAPFMNALPDRKLSSDSIMGGGLYHSQCPWSRKMFHLEEKRATQKLTHYRDGHFFAFAEQMHCVLALDY